MTTNVNRIQFLGPAELYALLIKHNEPPLREKLADGLYRLLLLHSAHIANQPAPRVGSIVSLTPMSSRDQPELAWTIYDDPKPDDPGRHVLTGGLVLHDDGYWGIHT